MVTLFGLAFVALMTFSGLAVSEPWMPQHQSAAKVNRIYAYRGWQSTGVQLSPGDTFVVRAEGEWLYSPQAGPNGPEGHPRFASPDFYPLPGVPGGALIGRVSDAGQPFYVGKGVSALAENQGLLYLRIDDDLLGDNKDYLVVTIEARRQTENLAGR